MDIDIYLIGREASLNVQYYKVKFSLEAIKISHPHKLELIKSMEDSEVELLQAVECFRFLEKNWRTNSQRNFQLERLNAELLNEIAELKKKNIELIDGIEL